MPPLNPGIFAMMRRVYLLPALAIACVTAASAQTVILKQNDRLVTPAGAELIHISLGINMFVPARDDGSEEALKAQEAARRKVYDLAAHECDILRDVLASDCRLETINLNMQHAPGNQFGGRDKAEGFNLNGNIGFRIAPK